MKRLHLQRRTWALLGVAAAIAGLLGYVAVSTGPFAAVPVTTATVQSRAIHPALFGIGTVEARYTYRIGPTSAGRVARLAVHVSDRVHAGQVLGTMDAVDLDERIRAQQAALASAQAALAQAGSQRAYAATQAQRYAKLLDARGTSAEITAGKRQELASASAARDAAGANVERLRADVLALKAQRANLDLVSPVDGLVVARHAEPGSTLVAGQAALDVIDPRQLWVDARFDQLGAGGLAAGLPVGIVLRSRQGQTLHGRVLRVDPLADAVTEETTAKIVFDALPAPLPPLGELAEVTVALPATTAAPTVPNAAIRILGDRRGVWEMNHGKPRFASVALGAADLDGAVQVTRGLAAGDRVIAYSAAAITPHSRVKVVPRIPGVAP